MLGDGVGAGLRASDGLVRGAVHGDVHLVAQRRELLGGREVLFREEGREQLERVAGEVLLPFRLGPVELLVVREGVRIRADDVRVDEGRPLPFARVGERVAQRVVRGEEVAAVRLGDERPGYERTSFEMEPPGVFTSTGTEIA